MSGNEEMVLEKTRRRVKEFTRVSDDGNSTDNFLALKQHFRITQHIMWAVRYTMVKHYGESTKQGRKQPGVLQHGEEQLSSLE